MARSKCLTCTFRTSCCSARLSRAPLSGTGKENVCVWGGGGGPLALAGKREYKKSDRDRYGSRRRVLWNLECPVGLREREREMFYLTTHSTHFIYGYMASDIWLRTILIVRKETRCRHTGYSFRLAARVLLYAPSHRQDSTYHGLCYTSRGALGGTRNSSMGPPHEGSIRRPIAP